MQRILVTGASGFLGRYVALQLKAQYRVYALYHHHPMAIEGCALAPLDIADAEAVDAIFQEFHPDVIVHTAALSDVDQCERQPDEAHRVNVNGTEYLAAATARASARFIYISTDQIYDGSKGNYDEADESGPLMVYGRTKLEGERRAAALCSQLVILRLALIYGRGNTVRPSFTDGLEERLRAGQEVPLFVDQYRTPLFVEQAASVIERLIQEPDVGGVFNLGGGERLSRYGFGLKFCDVFRLPKALLRPVQMEVSGLAARRPRDCSFNSAKIGGLLHVRPLTVDEGLQAMWQQPVR